MCYRYWRRHGVERPLDLRTRPVLRTCLNCGRSTLQLDRRRCHTCYVYWYRTGRERPAALWLQE